MGKGAGTTRSGSAANPKGIEGGINRLILIL